MQKVSGLLKGGYFPDNWDIPVAIGLGVVVTGYMGDAIAGFISQWVPAEWLNPASELTAGILLFLAGGFVGGDLSMWIRLFSFGAFAVAIADTITILLGIGGTAGAGVAGLTVTPVGSNSSKVATAVPGPTY
jgi:hypothetical protein